MSRVIYPRGEGASIGPVPFDYVEVHRWADLNEVGLWVKWQGTTIPPHIGAGGRVYVTLPGAPQPQGTGPCRIEFYFPRKGLNIAGNSMWRQIFQPVSNVPIYNVKIYLP